ncbi:MAG: hypothetical protein ACRCX2_34875 [Paraclostridium sp.]
MIGDITIKKEFYISEGTVTELGYISLWFIAVTKNRKLLYKDGSEYSKTDMKLFLFIKHQLKKAFKEETKKNMYKEIEIQSFLNTSRDKRDFLLTDKSKDKDIWKIINEIRKRSEGCKDVEVKILLRRGGV